MAAILAGTIVPGTVLVIRYEGPEGRSGDARDARHHRRAEGRRAGCRLRARSPTAASPAARGVSASGTSRPRPSTAGRSRSCATATGSASTCRRSRSTCSSTRTELAARREGWSPNAPRYTSGVLGKYARLVRGRRDRRDHEPGHRDPRLRRGRRTPHVAWQRSGGSPPLRAAIRTRGAGACLVDGDRTAAEVGAAELVDRLAAVLVAHLDEAEAAGAAGLAIGDHVGGGDDADPAEQRGEVFGRGGKGQVAHVQIDDRSSVSVLALVATP